MRRQRRRDKRMDSGAARGSGCSSLPAGHFIASHSDPAHHHACSCACDRDAPPQHLGMLARTSLIQSQLGAHTRIQLGRRHSVVHSACRLGGNCLAQHVFHCAGMARVGCQASSWVPGIIQRLQLLNIKDCFAPPAWRKLGVQPTQQDLGHQLS